MINKLEIIDIEYLYLDLSKCKMCINTIKNLESAISKIEQLLSNTTISININKIHIDTEDKAREQGFEVSPTIRINGNDIQHEWVENKCKDCGNLCGCVGDISCRVWKWDNKEYLEAPEGLIIDAVLNNIYNFEEYNNVKNPRGYMLDRNINRFFEEKTNRMNLNDKCLCC